MWADVYQTLLTQIPTFTDLDGAVFDADTTSHAELTRFAIVGADSLAEDRSAGGITAQETFNEAMIAEQGFVNVLFGAQTGDTDIATLRAAVDGWYTQLTDLCRTPDVLGASHGDANVTRFDITQALRQEGALVLAAASVTYTARF